MVASADPTMSNRRGRPCEHSQVDRAEPTTSIRAGRPGRRNEMVGPVDLTMFTRSAPTVVRTASGRLYLIGTVAPAGYSANPTTPNELIIAGSPPRPLIKERAKGLTRKARVVLHSAEVCFSFQQV